MQNSKNSKFSKFVSCIALLILTNIIAIYVGYNTSMNNKIRTQKETIDKLDYVSIVSTTLNKDTPVYKLEVVKKILEKFYTGEINNQKVIEGVIKGILKNTKNVTREEFSKILEEINQK